MEPWRACRPVASDTHHFDEKQDPDPHRSQKSDPDPDPHRSDKSDPYPHEGEQYLIFCCYLNIHLGPDLLTRGNMGVPGRRGWLHPRVPVTEYVKKLISQHFLFLTCGVRREIKTKANFYEGLPYDYERDRKWSCC